MASHRELVQYQKSLCGRSEILRFPLGPLGIPDMKFLEIPKDFLIDHLIGEEVKITDSRGKIQVNLCQKFFFLQNIGENMLCTKIVLNVGNNFCTEHVLPRFELGIFMY